MAALESRELAGMKNFAANGPVGMQTVAEFVAMVPAARRVTIAETLASRVRAGQPMQHNGKTLSLATMAAIAVAL